MKNQTSIAFAFESLAVRVIPNDENPLFVAKDVAIALGYSDPTNAIKQFCKGVVIHPPFSTKGGKQEVRVIEEPDVYRLIFGSKLESAERFQDWVFEEVLPSIRKTGGYGFKPADEIRFLNQRISLLRELRKEKNPLLRAEIYGQYQSVSDRLHMPTPDWESVCRAESEQPDLFKDGAL